MSSSWQSMLRRWYWATPVPHWVHAVPEVRAVSGLLRKGDVTIDIGADVGLFTLAMARAVGSTGSVLACEPHPVSRSILEFGLRARGICWVGISPCALGDQSAEVYLTTPRTTPTHEHPPLSWIACSRSDNQTVIQRPVPMVTLDHLVEQASLQRLDLIKIDVEGFEKQVISGGKQTLARFSPILLLEMEDRHTKRFGYSTQELQLSLENLGYEPFWPMVPPCQTVNRWFRKRN